MASSPVHTLPRFGAHESIAGGVHTAFERGVQAGCDVLQIFTKSNHQWRARPLPNDEIDRYYAARERTGIPVVCCHASYLINLASPDEELNEKSYESLRVETDRCQTLAIPNLIFHPGAHVGSGADAGLARIALNLNRLLDDFPADRDVTLCLEATAGAGSNLGSCFEELSAIIDAVDSDRVGVCIDSCHIFAAGYSLVKADDYHATMDELCRVVGLSRLRILHLNDSKMPLGSHRDRHEHIGQGCIGIEGFSHIVNDARLAHIPMVLETPKGNNLAEDRRNLARLRALRRLQLSLTAGGS
ncbi:MAG: deoxyribonuclease IV [Candidatus Latescibacterota bacterium]|nr:deoxyribonuclease IV [Candidatus Latescibacterota bacterium]